MLPQTSQHNKVEARTQSWDRHDSCDWPDDMVHAAKPSQMKRALESRGHKVTEDQNGMYDEVRHGVLPVSVRYFKPAKDEAWRITDRARVLRALKLFGFFCLIGVVGGVSWYVGWYFGLL